MVVLNGMLSIWVWFQSCCVHLKWIRLRQYWDCCFCLWIIYYQYVYESWWYSVPLLRCGNQTVRNNSYVAPKLPPWMFDRCICKVVLRREFRDANWGEENTASFSIILSYRQMGRIPKHVGLLYTECNLIFQFIFGSANLNRMQWKPKGKLYTVYQTLPPVKITRARRASKILYRNEICVVLWNGYSSVCDSAIFEWLPYLPVKKATGACIDLDEHRIRLWQRENGKSALSGDFIHPEM